jgi:hypothetical protein
LALTGLGVAVGVVGVGIDGYNGFVLGSTSGKIGAALTTGGLLSGLILTGPAAVAVGIGAGITSLYVSATVHNEAP